MTRRRARGGARRPARALALVGFAVAIALAGAPGVLDAWHAEQACRQRSEMASACPDGDDPDRLELMDRARAWNEDPGGRRPDGGAPSYGEQLSYGGRPEMAWVDIPAIGVSQPVYHGVDEAALAAGVGHLPSSALPVGGSGTRCVLAGHSGMPGRRIFDDLPKLAQGDRFTVWTLGEAHGYRVVDSAVVEPGDAGVLEPEPGRDLCTLVTCTSSDAFGLRFERLNDLRLVVTGERCDPAGPGDGAAPGDLQDQPGPTRAYAAIRTALAALPPAACLAAALLALARRRGKEGKWGGPGKRGSSLEPWPRRSPSCSPCPSPWR